MLTGQAKRDYQREYMRKRRESGLTVGDCKTSGSEPLRRFRILQRDNFRCQYCGKTAKDDTRLEIDHITPLCEGGSNEDSNLVTACFDCNRSKGGRVLDYDAEQTITDRVTPRQDDSSHLEGSELIEYLKHTPLEQLEKEGRLFIPNWRRLQG